MSKSRCDHDCFNCQFADCIEGGQYLSAWERSVLKWAHCSQTPESVKSAAIRMKNEGCTSSDICECLGISGSTYARVIKGAAKRLQPV